MLVTKQFTYTDEKEIMDLYVDELNENLKEKLLVHMDHYNPNIKIIERLKSGNNDSKTLEELALEFYHFQITKFFAMNKIPKKHNFDSTGTYVGQFLDELNSYFAMFLEILRTEVKMSFSSELQYLSAFNIEDEKLASKYLFSYFNGYNVKAHRQINRYFIHINVLSPFLNPLFDQKNGRFFQNHIQRDSEEFMVALFSIFSFQDTCHKRLFLQKLMQWRFQRFTEFDPAVKSKFVYGHIIYTISFPGGLSPQDR